MDPRNAQPKAASGRCPRCGAQATSGMDECPSCEQPLCPECGAAVGEDATACPSCGAKLELFCPNCDADLEPDDVYCPNCGMRFEATPDEPPARQTKAPDTWETLPKARGSVGLARSAAGAPACSACGRQDETVRGVVYPYVVSALVVTYRRAFAGVWCRRHRNVKLVLASLITSTVGWLGIPFGFVFTPMTLFQLARGGKQPAELNVRLLKDLAEHKAKGGDVPGAIRCLEAALKFGDDRATWERLEELYGERGPLAGEESRRQALLIVGALLGAVVLGGGIGLLDYLFEIGFSTLMTERVSIYVVILSWLSLVGMAFVGGLVLLQLIEEVLTRLRWRQKHVVVMLALVLALLMLYGLPEGRAIGVYARILVSGESFESTGKTISTGAGVLAGGGAVMILEALETEELWGGIYLLILMVCAVYYVGMSISVAQKTVDWQSRIAYVRAGLVVQVSGKSLALGGLATLGVLIAWAACITLVDFGGLTAYSDAKSRRGHGVELYEQGKLGEAITELEEAVRLRPKWARAHADLGWVYYKGGRLDEAVESFQTALHLDSDLVEVHEALGSIYFSQGNLPASAAQLEAVIELNPRNVEARAGLGFVYYWMGETDAAVAAFEGAIALAPDDGDVHAGLGVAYLDLDQQDEAEGHFRMALRLSPNLATAHYGMGQIFWHKDDLDQAVTSLQRAMQSNPQYLMAHLLLGLAYVGQAEFDQAVAQFEELVALQPGWGAPYAYLAFVHYQLDQLDSMEQELRQALALGAGDANAHYVIGGLYTWTNRFVEAETHYAQAIELAPDDVLAYMALAEVYADQKKFDLAWQMCDKAAELDGDSVDVYTTRSTVYIEQENLDRALEQLSLALELEPENADVRSDLSFVYWHKGQMAQALEEAQKAVRLAPYHAPGHKNLAFAYYAQGELDLALAAAQQAVKLSPKYDTIHYILGLCYVDKGQNAQAIAEFEQFLALYRDRAFARDFKVQAEQVLEQLSGE